MKNPPALLRQVALAEGVSFLVLVFIAMPFKYILGKPELVTVVGWAHGALFVALMALLAFTFFAARWSVGRAALVVIASLVPFGPFLLDRRMLAYAAEYAAHRG